MLKRILSFSRQLTAGLAFALGTVAAATAHADYPERTIKLVVPFGAGGTTDVLGRLLANRLGAALGQTVIVENRAGAGSMIGTAQVARATPDGYTLLFATSSSLAVSPAYTKTSYDPVADFSPVILIAASPMAVVVAPGVPAQTLPELIALAKKKPGELNLASFGTGSVSHLTGELFKAATGTDMVDVPFNGSAAAMTELQANRVQVLFDMVSAARPHAEAGQVRVVATTGLQPAAAMPSVPTVAATVPNFESTPWFGIVAPANTPQPVVQRLNHEVGKALQTPEVRKFLEQQSFEIVGGTPASFAEVIKADLQKWKTVVKQGNFQAR